MFLSKDACIMFRLSSFQRKCIFCGSHSFWYQLTRKLCARSWILSFVELLKICYFQMTWQLKRPCRFSQNPLSKFFIGFKLLQKIGNMLLSFQLQRLIHMALENLSSLLESLIANVDEKEKVLNDTIWVKLDDMIPSLCKFRKLAGMSFLFLDCIHTLQIHSYIHRCMYVYVCICFCIFTSIFIYKILA